MRRLTPALLTLIMFGVVGLLIAAYVAKNLLAVEEKAPAVDEPLLPMAIADIPAGTLVTEDHLGRGPFPSNRLELDMLRTTRVIANRYTRVNIKAGQPIRANDLLPPNEYPQLKVAEGMRAVSLEVGDSSAMVAGMIKSGDFVDVLFTYEGSGDDAVQGGLTMRLFEGVRVIVVNRTGSSRGNNGNNHVTLELTEPQVNVVTLARDRGTITLSYNPNGRGNGGLALSSSERVTLYEILGLKEAEAPAEPFMTEIYRGPERATNHFNDRGRLIESYRDRAFYDRPQQEKRLVPNTTPAPANAPAPPVRSTDGQNGDQRTPPTALRTFLNQQAK